MKLKALALFFVFTSLSSLYAQTLPVGLLNNIDDYVRRQQLMQPEYTGPSLMIRPLFNYDTFQLSKQENGYSGGAKSLQDINKQIAGSRISTFQAYLLPLVTQQQFNSHHPYGTNDGLMINARGYQTTFSAGLFVKAGPLTIQLRPEVVYAQNKSFTQSFEGREASPMQTALRNYHGKIDAPELFGSGSYSRLDWGQSSIRLNFGPVSFGLSNENLWWGPGMRNSLLMTNNAPGFRHLTLNTVKPVNTPVGSFEAQIIAGRLNSSGIEQTVGTRPIPQDWRYISGIVFVYQPKWVPGLYLGFDRSFTTYSSNLNSFQDYLPLFSSLGKSSYQDYTSGVNAEDNRRRDQLLSLFAKWVMPESHSEIYFQYGREDHSWDLRDAFIEPEHSRAYVVGFNKLVPLRKEDEFVQVGVEFTQMEIAGTKEVRDRASWYQHATVRQGYTNKGQIIGAGIGPDNIQSIDIAWVKALKKVGLFVERVVHNNGLYYDVYKDTKEPRRHWVDLGLGGKFDWDYNNFILSSQVVYTKSFNYQYRYEEQDPNYFWQWNKKDVNNFHIKLGLMYRF